MEIPAFSNPILEVTCHHFCHYMEGDSRVPEGRSLEVSYHRLGVSFIQEVLMSPCQEPSSAVVFGNSTGSKTVLRSLHFSGGTDKIQTNMYYTGILLILR